MKCVALCLLVLFATSALTTDAANLKTKAQTPAPAPGPGEQEKEACMSSVMNNMMTCVDFMQVGGTQKRPDKACCTGSQTVISSDPNCLCLALAAAPSYGISINITRAATIPALCHFNEPPALKKCLDAALKSPPPPASSPGSQIHLGVPAPAPAKAASSVISVSYVLMAAIALITLSI